MSKSLNSILSLIRDLIDELLFVSFGFEVEHMVTGARDGRKAG